MEAKKVDSRQELSTNEASQISGLSRTHITLLLRQGKLEGRNFGHRLWTVYADSLENYLALSHKPGPKGPRKKPALNTIEIPSIENSHENGLDKS